ncbi:MAG: efflux RND transporter periplasmic adaptor subunit [Opitutaceae bacterium]|nr:efflux RND transporter periplasmic adaptor subunit [Opitutaceae bacterium]NBR58479.1 efflux RND transporter periplasmic adaptor subunit [Opitutaceae bacterium]
MSAPLPSTSANSAGPLKKKSQRTLFIILGGVVVLLIIAAVVAAKRQGEKATPVTVEKAVVRTITHLVTATGKVQPEVEVKISPEVAGELIEIPVIEGQSVKKGDLLVRIKPDFYQAALEQQEASLASAKATSVLSRARLTKAEHDFKQAEELYSKQLVSNADFVAATANLDVAKADFDSSLAQIRRTEGSVTQSRDSLAKTTIYSPVAGSISSLSSEVGERVVGTGSFAGTEIMRLANLDNMEVRVKVNENDIINVKLGDHTIVTVDAFPGRKFAGVVNEISSSAITIGAQSAATSASDEVTNFLVKISIKAPGAQLRPGMSATVDIETQTVANVVSVPIQSVTVRAAGGKTSEELQLAKAKEAKERSGNDLEVANERDDARRSREQLERVVFIKTGDTVKQHKVETGIADNTSIEIKSGVKAGDEVVAGSYAAISRKLKDGSKVMIEKPKKEETK